MCSCLPLIGPSNVSSMSAYSVEGKGTIPFLCFLTSKSRSPDGSCLDWRQPSGSLSLVSVLSIRGSMGLTIENIPAPSSLSARQTSLFLYNPSNHPLNEKRKCRRYPFEVGRFFSITVGRSRPLSVTGRPDMLVYRIPQAFTCYEVYPPRPCWAISRQSTYPGYLSQSSRGRK